MQFKPTRPSQEQTRKARNAFLGSISATILFGVLLFSMVSPTIAIIMLGVVLCSDVFLFFNLMDMTNHGDIWRINLRNNIESKYNIELPRIPDGKIDTEQPLSFKVNGVSYTMSYYQDPKTFEPFIVAGNYPVDVDPKTFEK